MVLLPIFQRAFADIQLSAAFYVLSLGLLSLVNERPFLLYASRNKVQLVDIHNNHGNTTIVVDGLEDATSVDFLYDENSIFWTDISLERIKRTWLNGSRITVNVISTGLKSPEGLACDWLGRKLYWTDSENNRIEVSNLDGSYRKVLYWESLDKPRAIALDPINGYMYWTDVGEQPKIERASMDGNQTSREILVQHDIYWPNGLTLDYKEEKIYWIDAKLDFIGMCDFDGHNPRRVVEGNLLHPFALTLSGNTLYWTDWESRSIHSCDKYTGENCEVILDDQASPMDIEVFSSWRQPKGTRKDMCAINNGGCSHLCLMKPWEPYYSCACPTGVRLTEDNKSCADGAEEFILLARRTDLRRISLDTPGYIDIVLDLDNIKHAIAIDYDPVDGFVYWTDDEVKVIRRAYLNGTGEEIVVKTELKTSDGIAVDWVARNLYWTDTGTDKIEVARLNGSSRRVLISEYLEEPRAICLDPEAGFMFWTDWGKIPKIERSNLDGSERVVLINTALGWPNGIAVDHKEEKSITLHTFMFWTDWGKIPKIERSNLDGSERVVLINTALGWPNGIAVDHKEEKIYWGDAREDQIEVANLDGSGRRVLVDQLSHIFGLSLLGEYIYWTDWERRSLERVNKQNGEQRETIIDQLPDMMGLKAINVHKVEGTNPCAKHNGGCSHLCLMTHDKGPICACPMGLELVRNGKICNLPEAFLIFTRRNIIYRMSVETNHHTEPVPILDVHYASAIDFDFNDYRIYWIDASSKHINRAFLNGSFVENIVEYGLTYPERMAVDWIAHNIYWVDSGTKRIEVARTDGSSRKVLVWKDLNVPKALAIDPPNGYMYWTDWDEPHCLERAWLDGSNRVILVGNFRRANHLVIDYQGKRLLWSDLERKAIESSDMDGKDIVTIVSDNLLQPMGLTVYREYVFWANRQQQTIERANKSTGMNRTIIHTNVSYVTDLLIFHGSKQSGSNACNENNGGCSHLCFAHPSEPNTTVTHQCACPTHHMPNEDNRTCKAPNSFLLFSQKNVISQVGIYPSDIGPDSPDVFLPIKGLKNIRRLAYDSQDRYIYWIEGKHWTIKKSRANGTQVAVVVSNSEDLFHPYHIAIDPYSRNMYWTCTKTNKIRVTRLDGTLVGVIISGTEGNPIKPRYIALNPYKGHMYWTNMIGPPTIERCLMDGRERLTMINTNLNRPGPLAIDNVTGRLYWADPSNNRIECSDLEGRDRSVLVQGHINNLKGIAVFGSLLYWIDKDSMSIMFANKRNGESISNLPRKLFGLSDLTIAINLPPSELAKHPCWKENGIRCSHLCIAKGDGTFRCSCPVDLVLKGDEQTCGKPPTCSPEQFTCTSGDIYCIPRGWRCDGRAECMDGSDEHNCLVNKHQGQIQDSD